MMSLARGDVPTPRGCKYTDVCSTFFGRRIRADIACLRMKSKFCRRKPPILGDKSRDHLLARERQLYRIRTVGMLSGRDYLGRP